VLDELVDYFLFEGTPHFLSRLGGLLWLSDHAIDSLDVSSQGVALVGSGRLGYSVSPDLDKKKIWREFDTSTKAKERRPTLTWWWSINPSLTKFGGKPSSASS